MGLDISNGVMAVGQARVRYHGTKHWLYLGHDENVDDDRNKIAIIYCLKLGYSYGEVSVNYRSF